MPIVVNGTGTVTGISVGGLPDGIVDTDMLAANAVTSAKSSGLATTNGITVHDAWAITAGVDPAGGSNDLTANWARSNSYFGTIGSAMTESSGVFTFPSTGIYFIEIAGTFFRSSSNYHNYTGFNILTTTDNSSYSSQQGDYSSLPGESGNTYSFCVVYYTFDVTNTSTHKVKFQTVVDGSGTSLSTGPNSRRLNVRFTRLGDT